MSISIPDIVKKWGRQLPDQYRQDAGGPQRRQPRLGRPRQHLFLDRPGARCFRRDPDAGVAVRRRQVPRGLYGIRAWRLCRARCGQREEGGLEARLTSCGARVTRLADGSLVAGRSRHSQAWRTTMLGDNCLTKPTAMFAASPTRRCSAKPSAAALIAPCGAGAIARRWSRLATACDGPGRSSPNGSTRSPPALSRSASNAAQRIGIWSLNRPEWTLTQFAAAKAGLILVTINPAYR